MAGETAPTILARLFHQLRPQRIRFDVSQHRQQVLVVLNHRALESPLPDVPAAAVEAVVALRVRHQQALHDPADRTFPRAEQQMDVVAHQAIAVQVKGLALLEIGQGFRKAR